MKNSRFYLFLIFSFFLLQVSPAIGQLADQLNNSRPPQIINKPEAIPWSYAKMPVSDSRQGGDDIESALLVLSLPFADSGTTCGYNLDNVEACPHESLGPDVVYTFTPASDMVVTMDMCGSGYDTIVWIWDEQLNLIACNDDYYGNNNDPCGNYVSKIEQASLLQGMTYFFFVAGYAGCGEYQMTISEYEPCVLDCAGGVEGEPALHDGYVDEYNSGCSIPGAPFQALSGDQNGNLEFCGRSGWFLGVDGEEARDTDWFLITIGSTGVVEWMLEAEEMTRGMLLGPQDCSQVSSLSYFTANSCTQPVMTLLGSPGDILWLWVGAGSFLPPTGFDGHEYNYICTFTGLDSGTVALEKLPWCEIKSRYR